MKDYSNVEVHQGTTEAGKDLVMWKPGDLGERSFALALCGWFEGGPPALPQDHCPATRRK
jgi:hypothetical protein